MQIKVLSDPLSVCQVASIDDIDTRDGLYFIGKTPGELSLVCRTESVPERTVAREDGWRGFFITETLDFSLIGILAKISDVLAEQKIGIFVVSTYNTDYILVKEDKLNEAIQALTNHGYELID